MRSKKETREDKAEQLRGNLVEMRLRTWGCTKFVGLKSHVIHNLLHSGAG